jgi:uncharacterized protein YecT (DUF1311 family)
MLLRPVPALLLLPVLFLLPPASLAGAPGAYPNTIAMGSGVDTAQAWYQRCLQVQDAAPPPADAVPGTGGACNASRAYYQARSEPHPAPGQWRQVRACALRTNNAMVLMMLYANGYGVDRNPELATRYACSLDAAQAETEARVEHLQNLGAPGRAFDYCDDITSGYAGAQCAAMQAELADSQRDARLDRYAHSLAPRLRPVFARLRAAAAAFAKGRQMEYDMQGTAAAALSLASAEAQRDAFLEDVLALDTRAQVRHSQADYERIDGELNRTYLRLMGMPSRQPDNPDRIGDTTITRSQLRATERRWIAYRDAWTAFLQASGSPFPPQAMGALLAERRIAQLREIAG